MGARVVQAISCIAALLEELCKESVTSQDGNGWLVFDFRPGEKVILLPGASQGPLRRTKLWTYSVIAASLQSPGAGPFGRRQERTGAG